MFGELHAAVAAGDGAVSVPVSLFVRIAACAGVEEGEDVAMNSENEIADVPALVLMGVEFGRFRIKACRVDDNVRAELRGRRIHSLLRARGA